MAFSDGINLEANGKGVLLLKGKGVLKIKGSPDQKWPPKKVHKYPF